ncbi:MAG: ABC transporter ATP-binding protein [Bdellovibrionaceae bacterium]|nr:ABC transporter ATP-binding protein [Pseudobdellovibrionaceae bacterium]
MNIVVDHLAKTYLQIEEKIEALKDVSFQINSGESLSIIGQSGSGKTTLLSLLAGLESPDEGAIMMGEVDIAKMPEKEMTLFRARHIGIVFQQYHLMPHLTALENVLLPLEINRINNSKEIALALLNKVGLSKRAHHLPRQMSGGENQRVAIARAMVHSPSIVLADEPSGSLDYKNGEIVMELLFNLTRASHTTLLLVTHDTELAQCCQKTLHLHNGRMQQ